MSYLLSHKTSPVPSISELRILIVKYLRCWGGDFYSPHTKVLLMNLINLSGDIISLRWKKYQTCLVDPPDLQFR